MTIKQFIEKSIAGGWEPRKGVRNTINEVYTFSYDKKYRLWKFSFDDELQIRMSISEIVLNPRVWQVVGKVEGWDKIMPDDGYGGEFIENCHTRMHRMIDALIEGSTIEQYIETL